jgi:hypothetical protein
VGLQDAAEAAVEAVAVVASIWWQPLVYRFLRVTGFHKKLSFVV